MFTSTGQIPRTFGRRIFNQPFLRNASTVNLTIEPEAPHQQSILSQPAQEFLLALHNRFEPTRKKLLDNRIVFQDRFDGGHTKIDFLQETADIRSDLSWNVRAAPADLQDRRVEITGPPDRKMIINAMNSGAKVFMADLEDSSTPTWNNQLNGLVNLYDAVRRNIQFADSAKKKVYKLNSTPAVLKVRPRGWHMDEAHVKIDGQPMSGSLFDFGLFAFHNAQELIDRGTGPYFYFPKLQHYKEAELWNDVMNFTENYLKLARGTIRCTVLIEHLMATFQTQEILYALRDHIVGLNCGRWDYIFSYIKMHRNSPNHLLQDRFKIGMTTPFMRAYSLHTIKACHLRSAHAMGGMAAQIPINSDPVANQKALDLVREDKLRECQDGHDGTWVAHPGLVPVAMDIFNTHMPQPNQVTSKKQLDTIITREQLLEVAIGPITRDGLEHNVDVAIGYLSAWLNGVGCVPLFNLMEDAATAEISRAQLWQWHRHGAKLEDGTLVDANLIDQVITDKCNYRIKNGDRHSNRVQHAGDMLHEFCVSPKLDEFLTTRCYNELVDEGY